MKIPTFSRLLFIAVLFSSHFYGQVQNAPADYTNKSRSCLTPVPSAEWDNWFNAKVAEKKKQSSAMKQQVTTYTIPVIVHVLHGGELPGAGANISQAQVNSQISVLNADFAGNGFNVSKLPSGFAADKANCNIIFSLAQLDQHGKALQEPGIQRLDWRDVDKGRYRDSVFSSAGFQKFFDDSIKPKTIWDPQYYLNIWVSDVKSTVDLIGYATFPSGSNMSGIPAGLIGGSFDDGVWIWVEAFGTTGTLHPKYNKGRTTTHEIGHWLALRHIWGDMTCGDDYCDDTPTQHNSHLDCPSFPQASCDSKPNGEMFMNFMDYCDDPCLYMFTWDQMSRMNIAMENGSYRKYLSASSLTLCNLPAQAPLASFNVTATACANAHVEIQNSSTGMPGPAFSWAVSPNEEYMVFPSANAENPVFIFLQPGSYVVTMTATNESGSSTSSKQILVNDCGIPAGIAEQSTWGSIVISPNPSSGSVLITGDFKKTSNVSIELFDAYGGKVFEGNFIPGAISLQLSELPVGVYFTTIRQDNHREVKKLVLSR